MSGSGRDGALGRGTGKIFVLVHRPFILLILCTNELRGVSCQHLNQ
jgi:hypothetical protein